MDPEQPHNMLLTDSLRNTDRLIVGSTRLKSLLESRELTNLEYLPVTILDHKKRPAVGGDYWIIHTLDPIDCLKVDECVARLSPIKKTEIRSLKRFVIDETKIDQDRHLFRVKRYNKVALTRRDLAAAIREGGFTGIR